MKHIIAALFSIIVSYLINQYMIKRAGDKSVIYIAPVIEETTKTLPIYYLGGSVLYVHIFFGITESVYDYFHFSKKSGKWAAVISVVSHTIFGLLTLYVLNIAGNIAVALSVVIIIHGLWNHFVLKIL